MEIKSTNDIDCIQQLSLFDYSTTISKAKNLGIEYVSFAGGGSKGAAYVGVLRALDEYNLIKNIKVAVGSSIGSIAALLTICEATQTYITKKLINMNGLKLFDSIKLDFNDSWIYSAWKYKKNAIKLFKTLGLIDPININNWIKSFVVDLTGKEDTTFEELYKRTGKTLVIIVTSFYTQEVIYMSYWSYPHFSILTALKASVNIPFLFPPIEIEDKQCINKKRSLLDGGIYENCPLKVLDLVDDYGRTIGYNRRAISFILVNNGQWDIKNNSSNDLKGFITAIFDGFHNKIQIQQSLEDYFWIRTIKIECKHIVTKTFNLTMQEKQLLNNSGYNSTTNYLKKRQQQITKMKGYPVRIFIPSFRLQKYKFTIPNELVKDIQAYETNPEKFQSKNKIPNNLF